MSLIQLVVSKQREQQCDTRPVAISESLFERIDLTRRFQLLDAV